MRVIVHDDIQSYEHKVIGNFTKRQLICIILALCIIAPTFIALFLSTGSIDLSSIAALLLGTPVIACGIFKPSGVPLEKIILYKIRDRKNPKQRQYRMITRYEQIQKTIKEVDEYEAAKKAAQEKRNRRKHKKEKEA